MSEGTSRYTRYRLHGGLYHEMCEGTSQYACARYRQYRLHRGFCHEMCEGTSLYGSLSKMEKFRKAKSKNMKKNSKSNISGCPKLYY